MLPCAMWMSPIELTVRYFACNDDEGWCKPVTQHYVIHWLPDRDAGSPRRGGSVRGGFRPFGGQRGGR